MPNYSAEHDYQGYSLEPDTIDLTKFYDDDDDDLSWLDDEAASNYDWDEDD